MIELACLLLVLSPVYKSIIDDYQATENRIKRDRKTVKPGLSSQRSQIKPLTPAQIALGKKAYLGPPRKRKVKIPKRHQPT